METQDRFLERPRLRRRVVRWVYRAFLAGLALAAAWLLWFVVRASDQGITVAAIRKSGGKAYYEWEMTRTTSRDRVGRTHIVQELTLKPGARPPWPEMLVKVLGPNVFGAVVGVELHHVRAPTGSGPSALVAPDPAEVRAAEQAKADALMARVGRLGRLQWLSIGELPVTDKGMENLKRFPQLETLNLAFLDRITGKGFHAVGSLKNLTRLEVEALPLVDDDFAALRELTALRVLTLQHVHLTDQGMENLSGLLDLSKLTLRSVRVKNVGLGHLWRSSHLSSLCLQRTTLDDLRMIRGLTAVRDLDISSNPIGDTAIAAVTDLPNLRRLDVSQTFVTNACLEALAKVPRLTKVKARDTRITHPAVEEFRKTHPRIEIELKPLRPAPAPTPKP